MSRDTLADAVLRVEIFFTPEKLQALNDDQQPGTEADAFEAVLKGYLGGFVTDLGLRTSINLEVKWLSENEIDAGPPFQVFINEQHCRMPLRAKAPKIINHRQLAFEVADVVKHNSALLLPESLSDALRKQWSTGQEPWLSVLDSKSFNSLLVDLIRRGHNVERARQVQTTFADSGSPDTFNAILEEAIQSGSRPPLTLVLPKKANDASSADGAKNSVLQKEVQDAIFFGLGMQLPPVELEFDTHLNESEFCVKVNDLRHPPVDGPYPGELFVDMPADQLDGLEIKGRTAVHPLTGAEGTIVAGGREQVKRLSDIALKPSDYWDLLAKGLEAEAQRSAGSLLTIPILKRRIESLEQYAPNLVSLVSSRFPISRLAPIMRELLDETISIRDIRSMFEGLASLNGTTSTDPKYITFLLYTANFVPVENGTKLEELTTTDYSNWVRLSLQRSISHKFTPKDNLLFVLLLTQEIEARLRRVEDEPLTPKETELLHKAILAEIDSLDGRSDYVILTTIEVRKKLRRLIEIEFPWLAVLCYQELSQDLNIQPLARISF